MRPFPRAQVTLHAAFSWVSLFLQPIFCWPSLLTVLSLWQLASLLCLRSLHNWWVMALSFSTCSHPKVRLSSQPPSSASLVRPIDAFWASAWICAMLESKEVFSHPQSFLLSTAPAACSCSELPPLGSSKRGDPLLLDHPSYRTGTV